MDSGKVQIILQDRKKLLGQLALLVFYLAIVLSIINAIFSPRHPAVYTLPVCAALSLVSFFINKKDYLQTAAMLLLVSILFTVAVNMLFGRGLSDAGIIAMPLLITSGSLFFRKKIIFAVTALVLAVINVVGVMEMTGFTRVAAPATIGNLIVYSLLICINGAVAYIIVKNNDEKMSALNSYTETIIQQKGDIERSLDEKNILIKDVHHRVKNNMQIISSLLGVQMFNFEDEEVRAVFADCQNKINVMSVIHEQLYQPGKGELVNFKEFVSSLIEQHKLGFTGQGFSVDFDLSLEDITIDFNQAIPLSLLINELISNSFKHAFKKGDAGLIAITMRELADARIELIVSDNGRGFVRGNADPSSIGLSLVDGFAKQINAEKTVDSSSGTKYTFIFKL